MTIGQWMRRLWYLVNRRRFERDLEREIAAHRAQMSEPRRFGNPLRVREQAIDVWGWMWLDDLVRDVRHGARQLVHSPGFAATAIVTLTLGIGANTAIFSVFNSLLLRPLPVQEPDRLAYLAGVGGARSWSEPVWQQIRNRRELFEGAFASAAEPLNLARGGEVQLVEGLWVSGEFFELLGVQPVAGRMLTSRDDQRGGGPDGPVAVVGYDFWQRRFGGSPDAIGRTISLDSIVFTIVGVAPQRFFGTDVGRRFDVAIPIGTEPLLRGNDSSLGLATRNWLGITVRLRKGQTADEASAALRAVQQQIRETVLANVTEDLRAVLINEQFTLTDASRGRSTLRDRYRLALVVLLVVVSVVLIIACVNIANLLLARAAVRRHEMSVRVAIGASSGRLARMLLAEAALLAIAGAVLGVAASRWLADLLLRQFSTQDTIVSVDLTLDWRVLLFTITVALTMAGLFAVAPAWQAARIHPAAAIGDGRGRVIGGRARLGPSLVAVQLALSLVLVVGAGLFIRTFAALASQDLGFATNRLLVVDVTAPMTRYTLPRLVEVYARVRDAVAAVPGVERAALSDITPIGGGSRNGFVDVPGAEALPRGERLVMVNVVGPGWFSTYGTSVRAGREFADTDRLNSPAVAVVNEAFVRRFFKDGNPIGHAVGIGGPAAKSRFEIVGIVADAVYRTVRDPAPPTIYTSTTQRLAARPQTKVSIRAAVGSPAQLTQAIAAAVSDVAPDLTLRFRPLATQIDAAMTQERLVAWLSGFFGTLALLLASIGLYGVTAYGVSRRRAEIGVRLALGAGRSSVIRLVMSNVTWPIVVGVAAGAVLSFWLARFVGALTWGLTARDPTTFVVAAVILTVVGALAGWVPAWRASRLDPVAALRL